MLNDYCVCVFPRNTENNAEVPALDIEKNSIEDLKLLIGIFCPEAVRKYVRVRDSNWRNIRNDLRKHNVSTNGLITKHFGIYAGNCCYTDLYHFFGMFLK